MLPDFQRVKVIEKNSRNEGGETIKNWVKFYEFAGVKKK